MVRARAQLAKDTVSAEGQLYHAALKFQDDKPLRKWFDAHLKGTKSSESPDIIQKGVSDKEITQDQAILLMDLLDWTEGSFGKEVK